MLFPWYLKLGDDASAISPTLATPSSAFFVIACGWSTSGSAWSARYLMVMDATDSVFQKRSTLFATQFNYKRTFKTNVSLLISFSNLVSLSCLADVFSLHTHLAILKQVHNSPFSKQICTSIQTANLTLSFTAATTKDK